MPQRNGIRWLDTKLASELLFRTEQEQREHEQEFCHEAKDFAARDA
jgi:hypothetical protein